MVKKHFNFLRKCVLFSFCHNLKNCYLILLLILIFITFARVPLCWFYGTVENLFMTDPWMLEIWHVCDLIMVILRLFTWFFESTMSFVILFILCESIIYAIFYIICNLYIFLAKLSMNLCVFTMFQFYIFYTNFLDCPYQVFSMQSLRS